MKLCPNILQKRKTGLFEITFALPLGFTNHRLLVKQNSTPALVPDFELLYGEIQEQERAEVPDYITDSRKEMTAIRINGWPNACSLPEKGATNRTVPSYGEYIINRTQSLLGLSFAYRVKGSFNYYIIIIASSESGHEIQTWADCNKMIMW
jgi:hypothetical protein